MRVVSLLPSATELLCFVGGRSALVGRSHECDFPAGLDDVPVLTGQRIPAATAAAEVDRLVREQLGAGGSLYTLNTGLLAELEPDLILTQDLCGVCSIDVATVRTAAEGLRRPPRILSLNPQTVEDVLEDLLNVGRAVDLARESTEALVCLRERLFRAMEHVNPYLEGPKGVFLDWTAPLYVGGHWTPQLIERAGGRHPLNATTGADASGLGGAPQQAERRAGPSVMVSVERLVQSRPEWLIVSPCGVGLEGARQMTRSLAEQTWWRDLPAVQRGRVAVVDGNQMFSRSGPRLVDAFEWLVGWFNGVPGLIPERFPWSPWQAEYGLPG
jgi:iron complex transport system substrate-binding protein